MNALRFLLIFVTFIVYAHQYEETLQLVHVFLRHGSRTPELMHSYPNDIYQLEDFQPMGWGQLTNLGKQNGYQLGKLLRGQYENFLGDIYTSDIIQATSTDYDRTKMTVLLVLAGLFPPSRSQVWDDDLSWIPIPYYFEKNEEDYHLRRVTSYCPAYVEELKKVYDSVENKQLEEEYQSVFQYIENNVGKPIRNVDDVLGIFQTLYAEQHMNLTLPKWSETVYPEPMSFLAGLQCHYENHNTILKRLFGGRMLKKAIDQMEAKIKNTMTPTGRKIYLYSGHEYNVINIMAALNVYTPHVPKYSAAVMIELHKLHETNKFAIKVLYARDLNKEPETLQIPGCETICEWKKFIELTKPHVPVNYTKECDSEIYLD
ncbi:acid phosphatase-related [Holotrichia oblita]|uniref:Acid phosphatase-related n=1 Tax=Holotrichia oblita TaxID=644536 RepID=A0ACB9SXX1_HOLOL|nr:acid phosphatase-related [Holotrichia oblita]